MAVISRGAGALARLPVPPLPAPGRPAPWRAAMFVCIVLAALTLVGADEPTYDPTSWLIWGREIIHGDLVTTGGPSWKPLPVLFTTPFALLGDTAAPLLWLVVARAGGLFAFLLAYRLGTRLGGRWAGVIALVSLALEDVFVYHYSRGNSEGLLAAAVLWAIERHLDGRPRDAFLLGVAAGLLRPELWAFVAVYGLWLVLARRRERPEWRTPALVAGGGVLLLVLWFVPEYIGSGNLLRAASRALLPVPDSPAQASFPFLAVFSNAAGALILPTYVGAVAAVALAARRPREGSVVLTLAALATALMLSVAAGAQFGFTGNQRYVTLPAAIVCVLSGVGWTQVADLVRRRVGRRTAWALLVVALAAAAPFVVNGASRLKTRVHEARFENRHEWTLEKAIHGAGGAAVLERCGPLYAGEFDTQAVAWDLHLHVNQVLDEQDGIPDGTPATVIAAANSHLAHDPRFTAIFRTGRWSIGSTCAGEPSDGKGP
jgi:hypothetical protein